MGANARPRYNVKFLSCYGHRLLFQSKLIGMLVRTRCPECNGTRKDIIFKDQYCGRCGGSGYVMMEEQKNSSSPLNISANSKFILRLIFLAVLAGLIWFIYKQF